MTAFLSNNESKEPFYGDQVFMLFCYFSKFLEFQD